VTLIGTGLLNLVAVATRIITSVVLNKVIAVFVGPAGYAVIGQFQNLVAMLVGVASGGISNGVVKGTAEYAEDYEAQLKIWRTAGTISIGCSVFLCSLLILFRAQLANHFLGAMSYSIVFVFLAASMVFISLNSLLLAVLNGLKQIRIFVVVNIAGSIIGLVSTGALTFQFGLEGALVALSINQAVTFLVSVLVCRGQYWFSWKNFYGVVDGRVTLDLLKFAGMAIFPSIIMPLTQLVIRNHLIDGFGVNSAGYWEALSRISGLYLTIITVPLSVYFLPRFAELRTTAAIRAEVMKGLLLIVPLAILSASAIYLCRDLIISLMFTSDFSGMRTLFVWQMPGDVIKVVGWLFGYLLISKGMAKYYIFTEVVFGFSWYLLVCFFSSFMGLAGACLAYSLNYVFYLIVMIAIFGLEFRGGRQG